MKKKIIIMALVFSLALVSLSGVAQAEIDDLQGYWAESHDGEAGFYRDDTETYHANISAVAMESEMIATNTGRGGTEPVPGAGTWGWSGAHAEDGWDPDPAPQGDDVFFISEHEDGYIWAARRDDAGLAIASPMDDLWGQYEPIPQVEVTGIGPNYVEMEIGSPLFTCRYGGVDEDGQTYNQGTFELLDSYAVFMSEEGGEWEYIGNAEDFEAGPDDPIIPYDYEEDPETIDTGHYTFNATELEPETEYDFMVRMNFDFDGFEGGYGDGLGSYTTWQSGESLDEPVTTPSESEFGPGLMIPVVATVSIFVVITVYRRKKYE